MNIFFSFLNPGWRKNLIKLMYSYFYFLRIFVGAFLVYIYLFISENKILNFWEKKINIVNACIKNLIRI